MNRHLLAATTLLTLATFISPGIAQYRQSATLDANGNLDALIASHAAANGVPAELVRRVIRRESGGNPRTVSKGNYGLMQIKLATARAMGYRGDAAGLLDANTNMTYAVKYLAGAYRATGGNADRAVHYYASGYYYVAKRQGLAGRNSGGAMSTPSNALTAFKSAPLAARNKPREARASGKSVASSSNLYTGRLDYY